MGRSAKFSREAISGAALKLVAGGGPRAATVSAIAQELGAPVGSIYHRYPSRELLLAELWMSVVEGFQDGVTAELRGDDTLAAAIRTARFMPRWVREHLVEARLLLLHRREDFVAGEWPAELGRRASFLKRQLGQALRDFCVRHAGAASDAAIAQARFALLDVPYGAVRPYVQAAQPPPPEVDELLETTVRAVLTRKEARDG